MPKLFLVCAALCLILFISCRDTKIHNTDSELISIQDLHEIPPLPETDTYGILVDELDVVEQEVQRNESLYIILRRHGVSPQTIHNIQQEAEDIVRLNRMRTGQRYRIYKEDDEAFAFVWHRSPTEFTKVQWGGEITVENGSIPVRKNISTASGIITSSLAEAIIREGVSQRLVIELAHIYAWTIDFYSLRQGDHFKVVYEDQYVNDEYIGIGEVKAAEFQHRGEIKRAYYFDDGEQSGYYDEEGNSVRRYLLRVPFEYNPRISSGFSHNRMHPILNVRRPHYGTDYAAPTGTPILAAGDGVVTEAQYRGGNGNIVQIRHNNTYRTAYLHLSRFASGVRAGARVKQGQVIGYVGQTGLATGPHLCYRLYVNDQPANSVTHDFPISEELAEEHMEAFLAEAQRLDELLDGLTVRESLALLNIE